MVLERLCTGAEWPMPCFNAKLSALALVAPLIGCASKPEGHHIVLHPPSAEPRVAGQRLPPRSKPKLTAVAGASNPSSVRRAPSQDVSEAVEPPTLTPAEKEDLFRRFEAYLSQPGHQ